jgi:biopolymer transport protein TolR
MAQAEETVIVTVGGNGKLFINKDQVTANDLRPRLTEMFSNREKKELFLKADAGVPYGDVVKAMADIKGAGIERLGMVTEPAKL